MFLNFTHMIESKIVLTHPPISIKYFEECKDDRFHKELLNQASLYVIGKRENRNIDRALWSYGHFVSCYMN